MQMRSEALLSITPCLWIHSRNCQRGVIPSFIMRLLLHQRQDMHGKKEDQKTDL